jgi:predicted nucleic acid-binding protein
MKRTFVDAGVLIAAARGTDAVSVSAMEILDDPDREFASGVFVKLELLPKSIFNKKQAEVDFYMAFFDVVAHWATDLDAIAEEAYREACALGLAAMDALHVAAARSTGADEFVTTEKAGKPIHRVKSLAIVSIHSS